MAGKRLAEWYMALGWSKFVSVALLTSISRKTKHAAEFRCCFLLAINPEEMFVPQEPLLKKNKISVDS